MTTLIININNNNKLTLKADERIDLVKYKLLRSNGFLYSNYTNEYIFNGKLETAIKELKDIQNNKITNNYSLSREYDQETINNHKKELASFNYIYYNDTVKNTLESIYNNYLLEKEKQEKEKAEKEAKEQENRNKKAVAIVSKLKTLKNGFTTSMYTLALNNYNMSELLTRSGVRKVIQVSEYLKNNNMTDLLNYVNDTDYLEIRIHYKTSYYSSNKILKVSVDHLEAVQESNFLRGGSGHYNSNIELFSTDRINFKDVVTVSALINDDIIKKIVLHYISYKNGSINYKSGINAIGMITEHITNNAHLQQLKQAFNIQ